MGNKEKELLSESDEVNEVYKTELNSLNSNKS